MSDCGFTHHSITQYTSLCSLHSPLYFKLHLDTHFRNKSDIFLSIALFSLPKIKTMHCSRFWYHKMNAFCWLSIKLLTATVILICSFLLIFFTPNFNFWHFTECHFIPLALYVSALCLRFPILFKRYSAKTTIGCYDFIKVASTWNNLPVCSSISTSFEHIHNDFQLIQSIECIFLHMIILSICALEYNFWMICINDCNFSADGKTWNIKHNCKLKYFIARVPS